MQQNRPCPEAAHPSPKGFPRQEAIPLWALHPGRARSPGAAEAPRCHSAALVWPHAALSKGRENPALREPRLPRGLLTPRPLHARPRPGADGFATILPIRYVFLRLASRPITARGCLLRLFGSSALRPFGPSVLRRSLLLGCPGPSATLESLVLLGLISPFFLRHFRVLRRSGSPLVPEAWVIQVLLGETKLPRECLRESYVERGRFAHS